MSEKYCPIPVKGDLYVCQEERCEWYVKFVGNNGCGIKIIANLLDCNKLEHGIKGDNNENSKRRQNN